jgi:hypothetical protein
VFWIKKKICSQKDIGIKNGLPSSMGIKRTYVTAITLRRWLMAEDGGS